MSLGKARRSRPGISWLWESIASPSKSSSAPPFGSRSASTPINAITAANTTTAPQRGKSVPVGGFSAVRTKSLPMRGVGWKLRERRRVKRVRRSNALEAETDVDYGALDPLDGEDISNSTLSCPELDRAGQSPRSSRHF
ncbi:hypothetical protein EDC04DRAFT_2893025 [Pisolithus marmoratus]|nr:hypothetical protein EDC04DRAFT_2893025 [Pisolithus marmoratus]